jgi:hypothetical protein
VAGARRQVDLSILAPGDIIEVQEREVVFLLMYTGKNGRQIYGQELLDLGEAPSSLRGERIVAAVDVVRIVRKAERRPV